MSCKCSEIRTKEQEKQDLEELIAKYERDLERLNDALSHVTCGEGLVFLDSDAESSLTSVSNSCPETFMSKNMGATQSALKEINDTVTTSIAALKEKLTQTITAAEGELEALRSKLQTLVNTISSLRSTDAAYHASKDDD